jgi:hypothetical protein
MKGRNLSGKTSGRIFAVMLFWGYRIIVYAHIKLNALDRDDVTKTGIYRIDNTSS